MCASDRAGVGDRFAFMPAAPVASGSASGAPSARARPRVDERALEEQRAVIVGTPVTKVRVARVRAAATPAWAVRGEVALRHQAWATFNASDASFQKPVLDAGVRANLGF